MMKGLASLVAAHGRGEDSQLVHMTPNEVHALQGLASLKGSSLTTNPRTGLPEAGILSTILPMVASYVGFMYGGPGGAAIGNAAATKLTGGSDKQALIGAALSYGGGTLAGGSGFDNGLTQAGGGVPVTDAAVTPVLDSELVNFAPEANFIPEGMVAQAFPVAPAAPVTAPQVSPMGSDDWMSLNKSPAPSGGITGTAGPGKFSTYGVGDVASGPPVGGASTLNVPAVTQNAVTPTGTTVIPAGGAGTPTIGANAAGADSIRSASAPWNTPEARLAAAQGATDFQMAGSPEAAAPWWKPFVNPDTYYKNGKLTGAGMAGILGTSAIVGQLGTRAANKAEQERWRLHSPFSAESAYRNTPAWHAATGGLAGIYPNRMPEREVLEDPSVVQGAEPHVDPFTGQQQNMAGGGIAGQPRFLKGPGDGMSDSIPASIEGQKPAALGHEEFVVPADVVSGIGNGSSDAGAKQLYAMMDRVRKARTGTTKQGKKVNPLKLMPA